MYLSLADVALALRNATKKGPTGYFLGSLLWGTLDSNVGGVVIKVQRYDVKPSQDSTFVFRISSFVFSV